MPNQVGCLPFFPVMPHNHSSPGQGGQLDETSWGGRLQQCYYYYESGEYLLQSNDAEKTTNDTSGILMKEITLSNIETYFIHYPLNDTFRIKFDIRTSNASYQARAGVYKNGTLVGTLQTTTSTSYITTSQDLNLGQLAVGDKIQIYGLIADPSAYCYITNFRIYGVISIYFFKNINFSSQMYIKPHVLEAWLNILTFTNTLI